MHTTLHTDSAIWEHCPCPGALSLLLWARTVRSTVCTRTARSFSPLFLLFCSSFSPLFLLFFSSFSPLFLFSPLSLLFLSSFSRNLPVGYAPRRGRGESRDGVESERAVGEGRGERGRDPWATPHEDGGERAGMEGRVRGPQRWGVTMLQPYVVF